MHERLLEMFLTRESAFGEHFLAAAGDSDRELRLAHDLKGEAATLGSEAVRNAGAALEAACQRGAAQQEVQALLDATLEALVPVLAAVREHRRRAVP